MESVGFYACGLVVVLLAVLRGREVGGLADESCEGGGGGEAGLLSDVGEGEGRAFEESEGAFEAFAGEVGVGRGADLLFEGSGEVFA